MTLTLFTGGFAAALLLGVYLPWAGWSLPGGLVLLGLWLVLRLAKRLTRPRRVILGAALALLWLTAFGAVFHAPAQAMENRTIRLQAVVTGWPEETSYGVSVPVRAGEEDGRKVKALFYGDGDLADLRPGDTLSCVAYCTPANQVKGEESLYYTSRGILLKIQGYGEITVTPLEGFSLRYAPIRLAGAIRGVIDQLYPQDQAGFLCALLTGDRSHLDGTTQNQLNRVGLGHVAVISGLHVSYLLGLLSLVLKPRRKGSLAVLLLSLVLFCLMTGSAPGTVRASILGGVVLAGRYLGRDSHPMASLSLGLLVLLAVNPYAIANAGLQFSFLATAGIFLLGRSWGRRWMQKVPRRHRRWAAPLLNVTAVSLGAMVFTLPLSAWYFGRFSLLAPLSNLLTGWAVSLTFAGGLLSVLAGAIWLPLGRVLAAAVGLPLKVFLGYAAAASRIPLAALTTDGGYYALWAVFVYVILCLYLFVPVKGKRPVLPVCACVVTLCLSVLLTAQGVQRTGLTVAVLDVGQGQSVALLSQGATALVDCGGSADPGDTAATYLQSLGRSRLDLLVLTHFHEDHAGGVPELLARVEVGTIALPDVDPDSTLRQEIETLSREKGIELCYIRQTSQVTLGGAELTLIPPLEGSKETNEQCLVLLCARNGWEALFTGDLPAPEEQRLAARGLLPDGELLVAGHHGSQYATSQALLEAFTPETAVISVGKNNSYGHPAPAVLDRLAAAGASVYRTDQMGTVTISIK